MRIEAIRRIVALVLCIAVLSAGIPLTAVLGQAGLADAALREAISQLGRPYIFGAQGPEAFDCSGLVIYSYRQVDRDLPLRIGPISVDDVTIDDMWRYNVMHIPAEEMRPGDIVFVTHDRDKVTHGGMFVRWVSQNEFEFLNASSYSSEVVVERWPVNGKKRDQWFVGAGRLLPGPEPDILGA